jgi:hypothetical protein
MQLAGGDQDKICFGMKSGTNQSQTFPCYEGIRDGDWHHVVGVRSSTTTVDLYVDGALVNTITNDNLGEVQTEGGSSSFAYVGHTPAYESPYGDGDIDDLRMYDRALTKSEIQDLFAEGDSADPPAITSFSENFNDGDYTSDPEWTVDNNDDYPGDVSIVDNAVRFYRTGAGGNGGAVAIRRETMIEISNSTTLSFDAKAVYRSVGAGCGWNCGEYPANVQLALEDDSGNEYVVKYSVNYGDAIEDKERENFKQYAISIPRDVWERNITFIPTEAWPAATKITRIDLFAAGWDYEGYIDNIVIE